MREGREEGSEEEDGRYKGEGGHTKSKWYCGGIAWICNAGRPERRGVKVS